MPQTNHGSSMRFLGRRVHLALAVVLVRRLAQQLSVAPRAVERWRLWWRESFPATRLWQAMCARFMPALDLDSLPAALPWCFAGAGDEPMWRLLMFLSPLTASMAITLREGR